MAAFEYTALDPRGKRRKGVVEGDSGRQVRQMLRDQGLAPLSVTAATGAVSGAESANGFAERFGGLWGRLGGGMSMLDITLFTRQLATLIGAGLPIEEALRALGQQAGSAASERWS